MSERIPAAEPAASVVPTAPGAVPVLGHLPRMRHFLDFLTTLPAHGDLVTLRVGPAEVVVACTAQLGHEILRRGEDFDKGGQFFERAKEVVGNSLTTCRHEEHRRQRRLVQPAFHKQRLVDYARHMTAEIAGMSAGWQPDTTVDVTAETMTVVAKILARTMFQRAARTPGELRQVLEDIDTLVAVAAKRMVLPAALARLPTPDNRRYHAASRRLRTLIATAATEGRAAGDDAADLLSVLLAARDGQTGLSDTEIVDQLLLFQIAGIDTTATALAWALWLIGTRPDVERQLHAEVDAVLSGGPATHEHLPRLIYTRQVAVETLRRYPPVWILTRTAMTDTVLGGYRIPAGATIVISPYLVHQRPDLYPAPAHFDPGRWEEDRDLPAGAYLPFGHGARRCIGEHFAMTELTLALASITARWRLRPTPTLTERPPRPRLAASLRPPSLPMLLTRRTPG
ncbi:cytochrome P450 [Nocardia wallacei]|uniref:Cytochrome P450 n=1 Tax=Nocardia wallacei TaxID=480035 RepID=A0A7G1KVW2_9NOCA|nr:cytochrome P450 [Nocardia wallacei]BCK58129.1 cytochrome P450 [Nocardia wallacei]